MDAFWSAADHAARMKQGRATFESLRAQLRTVMADASYAEFQAALSELAGKCKVSAS